MHIPFLPIGLILYLIFVIWGIMDIRKSELPKDTKAVSYVLVILLGFIGFIIYWIFIRRK